MLLNIGFLEQKPCETQRQCCDKAGQRQGGSGRAGGQGGQYDNAGLKSCMITGRDILKLKCRSRKAKLWENILSHKDNPSFAIFLVYVHDKSQYFTWFGQREEWFRGYTESKDDWTTRLTHLRIQTSSGLSSPMCWSAPGCIIEVFMHALTWGKQNVN